jgi:hypothetical protein
MALAVLQASFVTAEGVDKNKYTDLPDIVGFLEIPADRAKFGRLTLIVQLYTRILFLSMVSDQVTGNQFRRNQTTHLLNTVGSVSDAAMKKMLTDAGVANLNAMVRDVCDVCLCWLFFFEPISFLLIFNPPLPFPPQPAWTRQNIDTLRNSDRLVTLKRACRQGMTCAQECCEAAHAKRLSILAHKRYKNLVAAQDQLNAAAVNHAGNLNNPAALGQGNQDTITNVRRAACTLLLEIMLTVLDTQGMTKIITGAIAPNGAQALFGGYQGSPTSMALGLQITGVVFTNGAMNAPDDCDGAPHLLPDVVSLDNRLSLLRMELQNRHHSTPENGGLHQMFKMIVGMWNVMCPGEQTLDPETGALIAGTSSLIDRFKPFSVLTTLYNNFQRQGANVTAGDYNGPWFNCTTIAQLRNDFGRGGANLAALAAAAAAAAAANVVPQPQQQQGK